MLHGNESISHYKPSNIAVWMAMAFQAGLLNIGGYMACHSFVSHVTGFATFFGYQVSQFHFEKALGMLTVPAFFLLGAMLSGHLVDIRIKMHKKPKYYLVFGVIFFLILSVFVGGMQGWFGIFGEGTEHTPDLLLLAILCLVCGIQNGAVTSVSKSVVRTTHLTGITTDLGIGIIRVFNKDKLGTVGDDEMLANRMRLGIIVFFGLGSVVGGFAFGKFGYAGFAVPVISSGLLFVATLYFQFYKTQLQHHQH